MSILARSAAVLAVVCLLASACGGNNDDDGQSGTESQSTAEATGTATPEVGAAVPTADSTPEPGVTSSPAANPEPEPVDDGQPTPTDQPQERSLVLTPVVSLPDPIALVARPGTGSGTGDLYVATRDGRVWLLGADSDEPPEVVLDIDDLTTAECEEGLLGIAFSSDGSSLYVHYTDLRGNNQIVEYPMSGHRAQGDQGREVLSVDEPACNHNGGHIAFGPDGYLWLGFGDGGGANDMFNQGQDLDTLLATMVRIDPEAPDESGYAIPADNPFANGGARPEIWAYGARNPWRFSFDRATGDLWIADVGQNDWEEIHVLWAADGWAPGANLGWPLFEGNERFAGTATPDDLDFPVHVYSHDVGCSVTGGHVYRGSAIPHLEGAYVFGDYCAGRLWALTIDDEGVDTRVELGLSVPQVTLVSFGEDASGELYVLSFDGTVYRLEPAQ
ncbi:MAG: PQQ-dependent sugar dehydrogenase [bacterium]|nr:PQQ-dependent sugar dehydrogenase [bacterium]